MLPDQQARNLAVTESNKNIVVIAGAGTGKTRSLVDRITWLCLVDGIPITEIVALTFTEKAAAEMKLRIYNQMMVIDLYYTHLTLSVPSEIESLITLLGKVKGLSKDVIRSRTVAVLENIDRTQIGTIHSFAAHLIRLFPVEAKIDPGFIVDDGGMYETTLFLQDWQIWLATELTDTAPRKSVWKEVLSEIELEDLESLTRRLISFRYHSITNQPYSSLQIHEFKHLAEEAEILAQRCAAASPRKGREAVVCKNLTRAAQWFRNVSKLTELQDTDDVPFSPGKKLENIDEETYLKVKEILSIAEKLRTVNDQLIDNILTIVTPFINQFRVKYLREGYISFDGLLLFARNLVRDNFNVRVQLKCQFRTVLIDEFQDTDPLQTELLFYLTAEVPESYESSALNTGSGRAKTLSTNQLLGKDSFGIYSTDGLFIKVEPGKLFIVGDPKQSIYRFRNADIATFTRITELIKSQSGHELRLQTNFRSNRLLIGTINALFHKLIVKTGTIQPEYIPILANPIRQEKIEYPTVEFVIFDTNGQPDGQTESKSDVNANEVREAEAEYIAQWIKSNVGVNMIYDQKTPGLRALHYGDIAILLRTTSPLNIYVEALKRYEVPYIVEGEKYFYTTQEVLDFLNLLRIVVNHEDKISLVGLLRSPLVGLSDRMIYELSAAEYLTYTKEVPPRLDQTGIVNRLYTQLRNWHNIYNKVPLSELLNRILTDSYILELASLSYHHQQTVANLLKFKHLALTMAELPGLTLPEFITEIVRRVKETIEEKESPLSDETMPMVRVLTIHKAKGLEFPVVFIPNLHGKLRYGVEGNEPALIYDWQTDRLGIKIGRYKNSAMLDLEKIERERQRLEELRVLYVAMTRARERVIMLGKNELKQECYIKYINQSLVEHIPTVLKGIHQGLNEVIPQPEKKGGFFDFTGEFNIGENGKIQIQRLPITTEPRRLKKRKTLPVRDKVDYVAIAKSWVSRRDKLQEIVRVPGLVAATKIQNQDMVEDEYVNSILSQPEKGISGGEQARVIGTICHKVLEQFQFQPEYDRNLYEQLIDRLVKLYQCTKYGEVCPKLNWDDISNEVKFILTTFLNSPNYDTIRYMQIIGKEVPVMFQENGITYTGTIDLLCKDETGLVIYDYKTDTVPESTNLTDYVSKYTIQEQVYTTAIRQIEKTIPLKFRLLFLRTGTIIKLGGT